MRKILIRDKKNPSLYSFLQVKKRDYERDN